MLPCPPALELTLRRGGTGKKIRVLQRLEAAVEEFTKSKHKVMPTGIWSSTL